MLFYVVVLGLAGFSLQFTPQKEVYLIYFSILFRDRLSKNNTLTSLDGADLLTDGVSTLDISTGADSNPKCTAENIPGTGTVECKCGMPLCICEAPAPSRDQVFLPVESCSYLKMIYSN